VLSKSSYFQYYRWYWSNFWESVLYFCPLQDV